MNPKKFSYLMIVLVTLLFVAIVGGTVGGYTLLQKQAKRLSDLKAQDEVTKQQEVSLAQAKADIQKYTPLNEIAKSIVPQDKDQAKTVREINMIASENGIALQQINFDTSSLGQAGSKTTKPGLTQVKPVEGIKGVYSLEITISTDKSSSVPYDKFLQFLEDLEANRRTAHVTSISVTPDPDNASKVSFSLVLNAYLKP